jgi:hypothetical protein
VFLVHILQCHAGSRRTAKVSQQHFGKPSVLGCASIDLEFTEGRWKEFFLVILILVIVFALATLLLLMMMCITLQKMI